MINFINKKNNSIIQERNKKNALLQNIIAKNNLNNRINMYNSLRILFPPNKEYKPTIPLNLYTCWHTKELPPLMKQNYEQLKIDNPEFNHFLYDEDDCRDFIKNNFDESVLNAYNSLIPSSYKSDLWRFCILYVNGGVYLDIKYKCVNGFKFISLTEKEHFVRDRPEDCVYTALIVTLPKNEILLKCINQIVENVKNRYYGINSLYPTGPGLLGSFFTNNEIQNLEPFFTSINEGYYYIVYKDTKILDFYPEYRDEQSKNQKNKPYYILWDEKNIYT
jgi:mannosyltransferase OCH1-like enzyme